MANLLNNMLTLQVEHQVPMLMDLSTKELLEYYQRQNINVDSVEKSKLLQAVITDLEEKLKSLI